MTDETTVQQTMVTGKCEQCGDEIAPGKDAAAFARNKALHMRVRHGVQGGWARAHRKDPRHPNHKPTSVAAHFLNGGGSDDVPKSVGMHSKGTPEQRKAWSQNAIAARRARLLGLNPKHGYTKEELDLAGPMSPEDQKRLTPEQRRTRLRMRKNIWFQQKRAKKHAPSHEPEYRASYYQRNRARILEQQRQSRERMKVAQPQQPTVEHVSPVNQATQCKLSECPHCGTRFYMVKGRTE